MSRWVATGGGTGGGGGGLTESQIAASPTVREAFARGALNASDYGWSTSNTAAQNETAMNAALVDAKSQRRPLFLGFGTYQKTTGFDLRGTSTYSGGVELFGVSREKTVVVVTTDTADLLSVGGYNVHIHDLQVKHASDTPGATTGDGLVFYKAAYATFKRLQITNTGKGVAIAQLDVNEPGGTTGTGNWMFSCTFEDINVLRYSKNGLFLNGYTGRATGSDWSNVYIQNVSPTGVALSSTGNPIDCYLLDESVFSQVNVEDHAGVGTGLLVNACGNVVFHALHFERVALNTYGAQYVRVYGSAGLIAEGVSLSYCDVATTGASGTVRVFSVAAGGKLDVRGVSLNHCTKTITGRRFTYADVDDTDTGNSIDVTTPVIESSVAFDALTDTPASAGLKRIGDVYYKGTFPASPELTVEPATRAAADRATRAKALAGTPASLGAFVSAPGAALQTSPTSGSTARKGFYLPRAVTNLRLVFHNFGNRGTASSPNYGDVANSVPITGAQVGLEDSTGAVFPVFAGGQPTITVGAGGFVETDPIAAVFEAGWVYPRVFLPAGQVYYPTALAQNPGGATGFGGYVAGQNYALAGTIPEANFQPVWMPALLTGTHLDGTPVTLGIVGCSVPHGAGDGGLSSTYTGWNALNSELGSGGFIGRALRTAGIPAINAATSGDNLGNFRQTAALSEPRQRFLRDVGTMLSYDTRNDVTAGTALATIQTNLLAEWSKWSRGGQRVVDYTGTPRSSSTDAWLTNQTANGNPSLLVSLNTWKRDGCPAIGGTPAAVGATGSTVSRCMVRNTAGTVVVQPSGPTHPLYVIWEVADTVESARNSGIWKSPIINRTVADATASVGFVINSATAAFTSADLGRAVWLAGGGASGAMYAGTIERIYSATQIGVGTQVATAVAADGALSIGDAYTLDGLHPHTRGSKDAAAAIIVSDIV